MTTDFNPELDTKFDPVRAESDLKKLTKDQLIGMVITKIREGRVNEEKRRAELGLRTGLLQNMETRHIKEMQRLQSDLNEAKARLRSKDDVFRNLQRRSLTILGALISISTGVEHTAPNNSPLNTQIQDVIDALDDMTLLLDPTFDQGNIDEEMGLVDRPTKTSDVPDDDF